jgi:anti-anti-sigma factor
MSGVQSSAPLTLVTGHEDAHTSILWVVGPLDDLTADSFETECKRVASRSRLLVIELSSCSFLSAAGLRAFVRLQRGLPGAIALVTADAHFEMLFRLAGLERRLPRFAKVTEALATAGAPHPWGGSAPTEHAPGRSQPPPPEVSHARFEHGILGGVSNHAA